MPEKSAEEMQVELFLFAAKGPKKSKLDGYEKKEPTAQEIKDAKEFKRLHPHGKYKDADYHTEDKKKQDGKPKKDTPPIKSPSPKNGHAALDASVPAENSPHRAAIEGDTYVTLYRTEDGEYHGFVSYELKDVPRKTQEALRAHKLIHPKSGAILKK